MEIGFSTFALAALEALRGNQCISGYTAQEAQLKGQVQLKFDWLPGGADRAFEELNTNPLSPFGLARAARASLMNLLPDDKKDKIYRQFLDGLS